MIKKFFIFSVLLLSSFQCLTASAQVSCVDVLSRAAIILGMAEENGNQVLLLHMSSINRDQQDRLRLSLQKKTTYTIVAVGDESRVQDVDLAVYDENGNSVGKDRDSSNVAVVSITPKWTGEFTFETTGYQMSHRDAFYALIVIRED